jgi:hypothetical protein
VSTFALSDLLGFGVNLSSSFVLALYLLRGPFSLRPGFHDQVVGDVVLIDVGYVDIGEDLLPEVGFVQRARESFELNLIIDIGTAFCPCLGFDFDMRCEGIPEDDLVGF